jgi:hypothetical protein
MDRIEHLGRRNDDHSGGLWADPQIGRQNDGFCQSTMRNDRQQDPRSVPAQQALSLLNDSALTESRLQAGSAAPSGQGDPGRLRRGIRLRPGTSDYR